MPVRPTLLELRRQYGISSAQLARAAHVPLYQSYTVEVGGYIHTEIAEKVIQAFSLLVRHRYTIADIQFRIGNLPWIIA